MPEPDTSTKPSNFTNFTFLAKWQGELHFRWKGAARIAVQETKKFLEENQTVDRVVLVCFGKGAYELHVGTVSER